MGSGDCTGSSQGCAGAQAGEVGRLFYISVRTGSDYNTDSCSVLMLVADQLLSLLKQGSGEVIAHCEEEREKIARRRDTIT